jgi:mono/diheme cytochrome c family protein
MTVYRFAEAAAVIAAMLLLDLPPAIAQQPHHPSPDPTPGRSSYWSAHVVPDDAGSRGKLLFQRYCAVCHGPMPAKTGEPVLSGPTAPAPGPPGTVELAYKYGGAVPGELEKRTDLDFGTVRQIIRHGFYVMPPLRKTELGDADVDAIAAYLTKDRKAGP